MNQSSDETTARRLVDAVARLDCPEPRPEVDHAVLEYARRHVAPQHRASPAWVWPLSLAAAVVVCVGVFFQIARLMPQPPTVVVMAPPAPQAAERPDPAVGRETPHDAVTGSLSEAFEPHPTLPDRWRLTLEGHVRAGDTAGFVTTYKAMREAGVTAPLPQPIHDWALQRELDDLINGG